MWGHLQRATLSDVCENLADAQTISNMPLDYDLDKFLCRSFETLVPLADSNAYSELNSMPTSVRKHIADFKTAVSTDTIV